MVVVVVAVVVWGVGSNFEFLAGIKAVGLVFFHIVKNVNAHVTRTSLTHITPSISCIRLFHLHCVGR